MSNWPGFLPTAAFEEFQTTLKARLARLAAEIQVEQLEPLIDPVVRNVVKNGLSETGAHEGTVWLVDSAGEFLLPVFNSGPNAPAIVGQFKQPLSTGLISMVFATEQPFLENEVDRNAQQSKLLDARLQVQTRALIAVPLHILNACRGVVSCVKLKTGGEKELAGFRPEHLASVAATATLLSRLVEHRLLSRIVGLEGD